MGAGISELPGCPWAYLLATAHGAAITLLFVLEKIVWGSQAHRRIVRYEELAEGA